MAEPFELFDVFQKSGDLVVWIGADPTLEKAVQRAQKDTRQKGGCEYLILDQKNGRRLVVKPEQLALGLTPASLAKKLLSELT